VKIRDNFLLRYLEIAPAALALERSIECGLLARQAWPGPVLDIGCGDGVFARILFADRIDTGIDPDPVEIERARNLSGYDELIICGGDAIPKPDGHFKTVFSNSVLEHIPDLLPVLKEARRLMAPGARFYVTIPTDRLEHATLISRMLLAVGLKDLEQRYARFYCRFWRHYHAHSEAEWRQMFAEAGLTVVEEHAYVPRNLSTFYDVLTPLGLPSMIAKQTVGRWIWFPSLRRVTARGLNAIIAPVLASLMRGQGGCLVFYSLKRSDDPS